MANCLKELFDLRTNGNGYILSEWNHKLLKRDLEQLLAENKIIETSILNIDKDTDFLIRNGGKQFQEIDTGDIYRYQGPWERGAPKFFNVK